MKYVTSDVWPVVWVLILQVGWLLPNHYPPWTTFHLDAWVAVAAIAAAAVVTIRPPAQTPWHGMVILTAALLLVPALQFGFGLQTSAGNVWISTAYILGFLVALLTGARWETARRDQLADCLLLAIGGAGIVSVGLELHQWLGLDGLDIWSMGGGFARPFANLGQPNQLGTFLLWALLAVAWSFVRRYVGAATAIAAALYLLFGLALTASRTAWIGVIVLVLGAWYWRDIWRSRFTPWVFVGLAVCFCVFIWLVPMVKAALLLGSGEVDVEGLVRMSNELRPRVWAIFLDASLQKPWFGYGWNQVIQAQISVALAHPATFVFFAHSHNLFLDLILWCGLPLGLFVSAWLLWWFWSRARLVSNAESAVLWLFLLVVANHAMLELPLHHAYMFLPVGMIIGALDVRMGVRPIFYCGRVAISVFCLSAAILLALIIKDYLRVESSYKVLRFEWANIKTAPAEIPDVLLLTQWRDFFRMVRLVPSGGLSESELAWMRDMAGLFPSPALFQKLATALAMNHRPDEAALWLKRMCRMSPQSQCAAVKAAWKAQSRQNPQLAVVEWPE